MKCSYIIIAFVITALWDVVLRLFAEKKIKFLGIENLNWVVALQQYFKKHTVLSAALIAGFVGAIAYVIIEKTMPKFCRKNLILYLTWVLFISAIVGIPMRYSGLFPYLKKYYYDPLPITTIFTDAFSGLVVALTMLLGKQIKLALAKR